jgi:hypothetical protein
VDIYIYFICGVYIYIYIPHTRSIYLVYMCVLISQGLWPLIATERKKGKGANLLA